MAKNPHSLAKIFSPRLVEKAFQTFDKATLAVVVGAWTTAFFILIFALYTLHLSTVVQRDLAAAEAMEPLLPKIERTPAPVAGVRPIIDRLEKRFPELNFTPGRDSEIQISASDGAHFRLWLNVLSYIDTISPDHRWTFKEFCVGMKCKSSGMSKDPMSALLVPEKVIFALPSEPRPDVTAQKKRR